METEANGSAGAGSRILIRSRSGTYNLAPMISDQTLLTALNEVESALVAYVKEQQRRVGGLLLEPLLLAPVDDALTQRERDIRMNRRRGGCGRRGAARTRGSARRWT